MRLCDVTLRERGDIEAAVAAGRALDALGTPLLGTSADDADLTRRLSGAVDADVVAATGPDGVGRAVGTGASVVEVRIPVSDGRLAAADTTRETAFDRARAGVNEIQDSGVLAHLRLVDAFRTDAAELAPAFERFDTPVVLADSSGARTPSYVAGYLRTLAELAVDLERVGVAFRDDLGVATANALVGASMGVDRVDVSVAGLVGRAGTAALEEVVVAARTEDHAVGLDTDTLIPASREALTALGEDIEDHKPVLGEGAHTYETEAGAMLSDPNPFEPYDPETYGASRRLLFGKRTGEAGARALLEAAGREPSEALIGTLLTRLTSEGPVGRERAVELAGEVKD